MNHADLAFQSELLQNIWKCNSKVDATMRLQFQGKHYACWYIGSWTNLGNLDNIQDQNNWYAIMLKMRRQQDICSMVGRSPGIRCEVKIAIVFLVCDLVLFLCSKYDLHVIETQYVGMSMQNPYEHRVRQWLVMVSNILVILFSSISWSCSR